jgi:anti-sigma factor (TIGR02949 family)
MMEAMGMMRCEDALARLWDFLDGELPPDEENALRRHLEVCGRCYPQYDFQRAYLTYVRRLAEREHAPPDLRRRLFLKILQQERGAENGR